MKISVKYGIRSKSTGELYSCKFDSHYHRELGSKNTYILEKVESNGLIWTTDNIANALIVKNTKLGNAINITSLPIILDSEINDLEIVAIYNVDSIFTVISSTGIPQTIYDFISDDDEALTLSAHYEISGKYVFNEEMKECHVKAYNLCKSSMMQHTNVINYAKIVDVCLKKGKLKLPDSKNIVEKELKKQLEKFNN